MQVKVIKGPIFRTLKSSRPLNQSLKKVIKHKYKIIN